MTDIAPTKVLNQDQQNAVDGFFQFLLSSETELGITGPGGVGKTFTMGHMIDEIIPMYYQTCKLMNIPPEFDSVHMTATTNKAAEVLSLATGRPTDTIQSFLNLKVSDDYETGNSKLVKTNRFVVHERKIIFIDECSMIDRALYEMIKDGTQNCKIVYVGDHCQMAPVRETISPVFNSGITFYELKQQMRNAGQPALMALCQQLRNTVETGRFEPIKIVPGVIDFLTNKEMEIELSSAFNSQTLDKRVLAYTNKRVIQYNDHIRDVRGLPDAFTQGEFLINNNSIQLKGGRLSVEEEVQITHLHSDIEKIEVTDDVYVEIKRGTLQTRLGDIHHNVPIPIDREHVIELTKYFSQRKNWNRYFYMKQSFPDLRQRDASTVYKAQGSTLDTVYIDLENISGCNVPSQVARMLNVACSRAQNRIGFYGNLAEKYGGLVY